MINYSFYLSYLITPLYFLSWVWAGLKLTYPAESLFYPHALPPPPFHFLCAYVLCDSQNPSLRFIKVFALILFSLLLSLILGYVQFLGFTPWIFFLSFIFGLRSISHTIFFLSFLHLIFLCSISCSFCNWCFMLIFFLVKVSC